MIIFLLVLLTPLLPICYAQAGVFDFLLLGDVRGWPNHLGDQEPAVEVNLVPCRAFGQDISDEFLFRRSRIYFPRSQDELLKYDVLFFNHPRLSFFTLLQQEMMVDFMGVEGKIPIAYPLSHYEEVQEPWLASPVSEGFPIDFERFVTSVRTGLGQWQDIHAWK